MATVRLLPFRLDGIRDTGIDIGRGSYAVVKELHFRGLKCVGKEIHSLLYEEATPRERTSMVWRFEEECELLGRLHHPNIVQFLGVHVGASSGLPVLVMEYLSATLSSSVDRHGILPAEISLGILRDVALGLRYLHEYSPPIIHRDLSANNVLLTTSMSAKISDLGVAKILDMRPARAARMTRTQVPGTPSYMPPETMVARPKYTSKVDIFSMGVLIVHVLSGEWPIPSEAFTEDPQHPDNPLPVSEYNRRCGTIEKIEDGHPLLGLIRQCLSNFPSHRPDAMKIDRQVRGVLSAVPRPSPKNRLELLQQVKSLRAELQQSSREEHMPLRRGTGTQRTARRQVGSEIESLQSELLSTTHRYETLTRHSEFLRSENSLLFNKFQSLRAEQQSSGEEIEALRREIKKLQVEGRQKDSEISSLRTEIERMRSEAALLHDRSRTVEMESSISVHQRAANSKFPTGLSPHSRLQWRKGADAPEAISGTQAVLMGESVFVKGVDYKVCQYDWKRDAWNILPDCPVRWFGMAQFLGKLITVGGMDVQYSATGKIHQFNAQRWEEFLSPMATARYDQTVVTRANSSSKPPAIAACGGLDVHDQPLNTVEVYSHASSQWHTAKPLPIRCYSMTSVTINDTCYILGGLDGTFAGTKYCFSICIDSLADSATLPHAQLDDPIWMSVAHTPLIWSTAASLRGSLIAIGGRDTKFSSAIHFLTRCHGSWEWVKGGDLPEPRQRSTAVCLPSGELLVAGGYDGIVKKAVFIVSYL